MNTNKHLFYDQQLYAIKLIDLFSKETRNLIASYKKTKAVFPSPDQIYVKDIVQDLDPELNHNKNDFFNEKSMQNRKKQYENTNHYYLDYDEISQSRDDDCESANSNRKNSKGNDHMLKSYNSLRKSSKCSNENSNTSNKRHSSKDFNHNKLKAKYSDMEIDKRLSLPLPIKRKSLFSDYNTRKLSRFDFANGDEKEEDVPNTINDIICKKTSRFLFFRDFALNSELMADECLLFSKEMGDLNNSWSQFIKQSVACGNKSGS